MAALIDPDHIILFLMNVIFGTSGLKGIGFLNIFTSFNLTRRGKTSFPSAFGVTNKGDSSSYTSDVAS